MFNIIDLIEKIEQEKVKVKKIKIFNKNFIFVFDYILANQILINKQNIFEKNEMVFNRIKPITGNNGLVQMQGAISKEYRSNAREMFSSNSMDIYSNIVFNITNNFIDKLSFNNYIELSVFISEIVIKTALVIFLNNNIEDKKLAENFLKLNELCAKKMINFFSLPLWFPTINNIKIIYFKNFIRRSIKHYLYSDNNNRNNLPNIFKNSDSLIDQCMTFLFAGHETTASSITFTLLLLAKYPHYQELVSQGDEQIIKAIYKESLRLYPPAYMLVRQVKEKTIFNEFNLKAKDQIIIGVKQIHRSEEYYDKPNDFVPERFLNKNENYAFLPFGIGAKSCLGEKLAYLEAIIILKIICQKFIIKSSNEPIQYSKLITLHPKQGQFVWLKKK